MHRSISRVDVHSYFSRRSSHSAALLACILFVCASGCICRRVTWRQPHAVKPANCWTKSSPDLELAEELYSRAVRLERDGNSQCVECYFDVALKTSELGYAEAVDDRGAKLHRSALQKLVMAGQDFGKLDPRSGLKLCLQNGVQFIPITHHKFPWNAKDFERLDPVGKYRSKAFRNKYQYPGVGIPLVVSRTTPTNNPHLTKQPTFSATMVLRSSSTGQSPRIELFDPLNCKTIQSQHGSLALARDLSAPIAYRLRDTRESFLSNFVGTSPANDPPKLYTLTPYQRNKIPVVLIHGLFSNPFTWVEMVNELRASPEFVANYQIWAFEYPTGQPVVENGEELRRQLACLIESLDPERSDPSLREVVLVGHSLGGLVAKLAISHSGDALWNSIANRPPTELRMKPDTRKKINEQFFFKASPYVSRVVYIGTPHHGSVYARRLIGRLGSKLVYQPDEQTEAHDLLVACNPGVFDKEVLKRSPTSIDTMEPSSKLLAAIRCLPTASRVEVHSVIGDSCWTCRFGRSDGVVPIESARDPLAVSERYVRSRHSSLNKRPETIEELEIILNAHCNTVRSGAERASGVCDSQHAQGLGCTQKPASTDSNCSIRGGGGEKANDALSWV